jgi:hypothetical protein
MTEKMTAVERTAAVSWTAHNGPKLEAGRWDVVCFDDVVRIAEAHAAAAVAEVERERDEARSGATLAEGRLLELLDVLRERTDVLDRAARERDVTEAFRAQNLKAFQAEQFRAEQAEARVAELDAEVGRLREDLEREMQNKRSLERRWRLSAMTRLRRKNYALDIRAQTAEARVTTLGAALRLYVGAGGCACHEYDPYCITCVGRAALATPPPPAPREGM